MEKNNLIIVLKYVYFYSYNKVIFYNIFYLHFTLEGVQPIFVKILTDDSLFSAYFTKITNRSGQQESCCHSICVEINEINTPKF